MESQVHRLHDKDSRAVALERSIDLGKSQKEATDRDMHDDWDQLRKLKIQFNDNFEELVCTKPDELAVLLAEINRLANEVSVLVFFNSRQAVLKTTSRPSSSSSSPSSPVGLFFIEIHSYLFIIC